VRGCCDRRPGSGMVEQSHVLRAKRTFLECIEGDGRQFPMIH